MIKKIISIILLNVFIMSSIACSFNDAQPTYYKDVQEAKAGYALQSNMDVAEFAGSNLTVIPSTLFTDDENITAISSLITNITDNEPIYANNIYQRMYPASLTKIVTALVVIEQGSLDDTVTISKNAINIIESGAKLGGFKEGDKINMESLLNIFLVYSANDAGIALGEHISGSEEAFVEEMNKTAKRLGAVHSNFVNTHGLHHEDHYTTAYDLYLIFNELLKYDVFIDIIKQSSYTASYTKADGTLYSHQYMNTNRYTRGLSRAPDNINVIGGKTGTTQEAGNCLILYSEDIEGKGYISIILKSRGSFNLYNQMTYLLELIE